MGGSCSGWAHRGAVHTHTNIRTHTHTGAPADPGKALQLWEEAAQDGHTEAQYRIGKMAATDDAEGEERAVKGGKDYGVS